MRVPVAPRLIPLALALGAVPAPGPAPASEPEDPEALRAKVREAYGGDAAAALRGFRARGRILHVATGLGGEVELSVGLDGELRSEIRYPTSTDVRILREPLAWSGGRGHQRPAPGRGADEIRLRYHRRAAPFELLAAPADGLTVEGRSEEGWIRISRRWSDRARTIYEIDAETGRIRRVLSELADSDGAVLRLDSVSHDFREVDGVLFAFRETTRENGEIREEIVLERVTPLREIDPTDFRPTGTGGDI